MNNTPNRIGEICPACGEGHLVSRISYSPAEYKGRAKDVALYSSECDVCGSVLAGSVEAKMNNRAMAAFKKEVDGLLAGKDIKEFRQRFDLTQDICAALFGGGAVAFSRYEKDDIVQSSSMDSLIRLCMEDPKNILRLAKTKGVSLNASTLARIDGAQRRKAFMDAVSQAINAFDRSYIPELVTHKDSANDKEFVSFSTAATEADYLPHGDTCEIERLEMAA